MAGYIKALAPALLPALVACQSANGQKAPAILAPAAESRATHPLAGAISQLLNGANITLADSAFYTDSEVIIEGRLTGRSFEKPHHFRLWLLDNRCVLEHLETGNRVTVTQVNCLPE